MGKCFTRLIQETAAQEEVHFMYVQCFGLRPSPGFCFVIIIFLPDEGLQTNIANK